MIMKLVMENTIINNHFIFIYLKYYNSVTYINFNS